MTIHTNYFDTRTQARNAVESLNGKFKDFGADAPKGQRWAVLTEVPDVPNVPDINEDDIQKQIALLKATLPDYVAVVVPERTETIKNLKGKTIQVHYKKSVSLEPVV